jgi:hypothetical protein
MTTKELACAPLVCRFARQSPAACDLRWEKKVRRAASLGVCMSNADEYEQFCRELASLAAKRLVGQTIDRATLAAAFHEALLEMRGADTTTTQRNEPRPVQEEAGSVPVKIPSEVADIPAPDDKAIQRLESESTSDRFRTTALWP